MKNFGIVILITSLVGCITLNKAKKEYVFNFEEYINSSLEEQHRVRKIILCDEQKYIDIILKGAFGSQYTCCDCTDTNPPRKHKSNNQLLCFLFKQGRLQRKIQEYSFDASRTENYNNKKWANCYKTMRMNDCSSRFNKHAFSSFPYILRDTSSYESVYSILNNIYNQFNYNYEDLCYEAVTKLKTDSLWRKNINKSLLIQLKAFGDDVDIAENVYGIMHMIPDQEALNYAFNYLMNNDSIHSSEMADVIGYGVDSVYYHYGFKGSGLAYKKAEINAIKEKLIYLNKSKRLNEYWYENLFLRLEIE